jgi:protein-disulfide isomerase
MGVMRLIEPCTDGRRAALCGLVLVLLVAMLSARGETTALEPLAEVDGEEITSQDLELVLGARLATLEEQLHNLKRQGLESLIVKRLLAHEAARRGIPIPALLDAEVREKAEPVTDEEVEAYYQANKSRLSGDEAAVRSNAREHLRQQKVAIRRAIFVASLRSQATIKVSLKPPPIIRVAVSVNGTPVRGTADAPVTLVEFSDFHCPFCKRAQATLKQVIERYPDRVRHVYRDFPVDKLHPRARAAHEAARCAEDQGKFWEYHDVLFLRAPKAEPRDLRRYAEQVGLDMPTFESCVSTRSHRATVQRDVDEATKLGLNGTPAFFINGRPLQGAQPLEAFVRIIDDELARQ